jgi:SAM-dependent methyltransferase
MRRNERIIEYSFLMRSICQVAPMTVLDVGSGQTALPAIIANCGIRVLAVDKAVNGNRHFQIVQLDITRVKLAMKFDFISCVSVLEHIQAFDTAVANMTQMLNPGGYLCMTFPYNENTYIPNVYQLPEAGYGQKASFPCHVFCWDNVSKWAQDNNLKLVEQERWECFTGEFWTFGKRIFPPKLAEFGDPHHLTCLLFRSE